MSVSCPATFRILLSRLFPWRRANARTASPDFPPRREPGNQRQPKKNKVSNIPRHHCHEFELVTDWGCERHADGAGGGAEGCATGGSRLFIPSSRQRRRRRRPKSSLFIQESGGTAAPVGGRPPSRRRSR